jgi:hypothetical protein
MEWRRYLYIINAKLILVLEDLFVIGTAPQSVTNFGQNAGYMGPVSELLMECNSKMLCFLSLSYVFVKNLYWARTAAMVVQASGKKYNPASLCITFMLVL